MYDFNPGDVIDAREAFMHKPKPKSEPPIDEPISKIVGKKIYVRDPRVFNLVMKWKQAKGRENPAFDNFLTNPKFIKELKKVCNEPL